MRRATAAPALVFAALSVLSGCAFFSRQPPLPRRAAIEPAGSEAKYAALIQEADIIYFPSESVALHSRSDPAWKLLGALRAGGGSFAIGWDWSGNEKDRREYHDAVSSLGGEILPVNETKSREQNDPASSADQLAADKIATHFREHRNDKVLVFLRRERLGLGQGVPYLVAQQTKARQLILNPQARSDPANRLLAAR